MRKLYWFMMVSLDGFFEGVRHDLSWHNVDTEFNEFAIRQTGEAGTLLFGRKTYELMAGYWPTQEARTADPVVANLMNTKPKVVVSHSLKHIEKKPHWEQVTLAGPHPVDYIRDLKRQPGQDIAIFGSNNLAVHLMQLGLIDEYRFMVNPRVIGSGTRLFEGLGKKMQFRLIETKTFRSGNVLLVYRN